MTALTSGATRLPDPEPWLHADDVSTPEELRAATPDCEHCIPAYQPRWQVKPNLNGILAEVRRDLNNALLDGEPTKRRRTRLRGWIALLDLKPAWLLQDHTEAEVKHAHRVLTLTAPRRRFA